MKNLRLVINNDKKGVEKEKFFIKKELQCILNLYAKNHGLFQNPQD